MERSKILASLKAVLPNHQFKPCGVSLQTGTFSQSQVPELEAKIAAFPATAGWIARQSGVVVLPDADERSLGIVLEAELGSTTASLQIRRVSAEWVWTLLTETAGEGLAEDVVLVTTVKDRGALYRRYWSLPESGAVEVTACRLVRYTEYPT